MKSVDLATPSFNLWTEPWIGVENATGQMDYLGIEQVLLRAHEWRMLYEPSPLIEVGIHRLLVAILQDALQPQKNSDLERLWRAGQFPHKELAQWARVNVERLDLFSVDHPFMQSADLGLAPSKQANSKSAAYLFPEIPTGNEVAWHHHGTESDHALCAKCVAGGLVSTSAFAYTGGRRIRPSVNGGSPTYILPQGRTVFETLTATLITPPYMPDSLFGRDDCAWWRHDSVITQYQVMHNLGYLHSLTFPIRRVRLHPAKLDATCWRCGKPMAWGVKTMIYQMGERRPKRAAIWADPFMARRTRKGSSALTLNFKDQVSVWRDSTVAITRITPEHNKKRAGILPPRFLEQLTQLRIGQADQGLRFRWVGLRTEKARVWEWLDFQLDVSLFQLRNKRTAAAVNRMVSLAADSARLIKAVLYHAYISKSRSKARLIAQNTKLEQEYWQTILEYLPEWARDTDRASQRKRHEDQRVELILQMVNYWVETMLDFPLPRASSWKTRRLVYSQCQSVLANLKKDWKDERNQARKTNSPVS